MRPVLPTMLAVLLGGLTLGVSLCRVIADVGPPPTASAALSATAVALLVSAVIEERRIRSEAEAEIDLLRENERGVTRVFATSEERELLLAHLQTIRAEREEA